MEDNNPRSLIQRRDDTYLALDFDSLRARLIELANSAFPEWTDFTTPSFGNVLIELFAFVGDVIGHQVQSQGRESRLASATQRKNVLVHAESRGYRPHGATPARAKELFTLSEPPTSQVIIPAGRFVMSENATDPVQFQLLEDVFIPAGATPPCSVGTVEHSATHRQEFSATGAANAEFALSLAPYLDKTCCVRVGNAEWQEVETLLQSTANDRHFTVRVDQQDRAKIRFGDGTMGALPAGNVEVLYKIGGGEAGRVEANTLTVFRDNVLDAQGRSVTVTVTNPEPSFGGHDRETLKSIKQQAPRHLRAGAYCLTREDYEYHAESVPGVGRALLLTRDDDSTIDENHGVLFIVPSVGENMTAAAFDAVNSAMDRVRHRASQTFHVRVQNAPRRKIDVSIVLNPVAGTDTSALRREVDSTLRKHFAVTRNGIPNPSIDFGHRMRRDGAAEGEIVWSELLSVIQALPSVRKISVLRLCDAANDLTLKGREFPTLGRIDVINGATGIPL